MIQSYLRKKGLDGTRGLQIRARLGSSTAVKEGIISGLGLSIISLKAIHTEIQAGLLKVVKIRGLSMPRSFYLIRNKSRIASPACQAMREFLISTV
jgi:DNA-binding transcriptional LysR family regulator